MARQPCHWHFQILPRRFYRPRNPELGILNWDFKGQGEHIFLHIQKTNCNTVWIAKQLAKFYGVPPRDVGYSGLKDRHAVTTQYFSVRLPGVKPDSYELPEHEEYQVIGHTLHDKKLKRGNHKYNDFIIRLRDVAGDCDVIEQRLAFIRDNGCPNFFDSQRFGHNNNNLTRLSAWVSGEIELRKRDEKSIVLSALRSSIFNQQLAQRVANDTWQQVIGGDMVILDGSNSHFRTDTDSIDDEIKQRAEKKDIHPAGILIGYDSTDAGLGGEHGIELGEQTEMLMTLMTLMKREHLQQGYRSLRLNVQNLAWQRDGDDWIINMRLPTGAYASGVVRQVFDLIVA